LNKEHVSSNMMVCLVSYWVSFAIISCFCYTPKISFIIPASS